MKIANILWQCERKLVVFEEDKFYPIDAQREEDVFGSIQNIKKGRNPLPVTKDDIKWLPVVNAPSKIIGIGLNYLDHIVESHGRLPKSPIIFAKYPNALIGHKDFIVWSRRVTEKVDYEAELAVIIGKRAKSVTSDEAYEVIAGYTCANDVSARDLQFGDGQWTRGKSLDTFCPLGPYMVTRDEIKDPQNLSIRTILNGRIVQESNTSKMIFGIKDLIAFISRHMTLFPGDVILTGTPAGVGAFRKPPRFLVDGDEIIISIESIGDLINYCKMNEN
ncbi:MAG: fumarylacetoacetate hydrolase family protein [Deltaproteobacteria bacterium]|nr:fumarylacetoacetate hydrolase family protein [Deltaproteobacteria bacterium]